MHGGQQQNLGGPKVAKRLAFALHFAIYPTNIQRVENQNAISGDRIWQPAMKIYQYERAIH